ncbi:MAG: hypothetical protein ACREFK_18720 [Stellaceae bacterium]
MRPAQKNVLVEIVAERPQRGKPPLGLLFDRRHMGRQQPVQIKNFAFDLGKRRAFVQQRVVEQFVTRQRRCDLRPWFISGRGRHRIARAHTRIILSPVRRIAAFMLCLPRVSQRAL